MANEALIKKALEKYLVELGKLQSDYPKIATTDLMKSDLAKKAADEWNVRLMKIGDALLVPMERTPMAAVYIDLFKKIAVAARTLGIEDMNKAMNLLLHQMRGDITDVKAKAKKEVGTVGKLLLVMGIAYGGYKLMKYGMKMEERHKKGIPGGNHAPRVR